ncbi:acyl transferase [uncultured Roseivirga sp.]|uniref:LuxE/PaaK family acyltransferase n=1 Tax=uncultured Roseivirga sp. TaxID=543088 RepID=UPI0030DDB3B8|tara:strand:- start:1501 stop:2490 length:990 start_codon:yes stop_codon:yes gene_type:complete
MDFVKSLYERVFSVDESSFEALALDVFRYQHQNNPVYRDFVNHLGVAIESVSKMEQIPFLPIEFFKTHTIKTGDWQSDICYESSGTTGQITSKHWVADEGFYLKIAEQIFAKTYGKVKDYTILALLPSYLERSNSSLVAMANRFIQISEDSSSGFFLNNAKQLYNTLLQCKKEEKKTILLGVTFGLLDFVDEFQIDFPDLIVMETGGMKGRREELVREEVHEILKRGFGVKNIHSEYGMTELLSQGYSQGNGVFRCGYTMKLLTRDINDPLTVTNQVRNGGINIIDLANVHSCAFIETKDLGKVYSDGTFEVLGRIDNSDVRGCNLMVG